ncbi:MAG: RNA polymerase sigma factor [Chitinophagaceae bacterium]
MLHIQSLTIIDCHKLSTALSYIETHDNTEMNDLIEGCIQGNRASQEKIYKMYYPKMMSMVKRYTNIYQYHLAEEILNNGFLKVFQKIDSFRFQGSFEGWVRRIIYHSIFDYVRQHMKYNEKVVFVERDEVVNNDIASNLRYEELMKLVQELPDTTQTVFNMYAIDGFSHKEIGQELNISEGTSKWHMFEARKILKQKIERTS